MKENSICSICGAILTEESEYYYEDRLMCGECFERETVVCDCCSRRIWRDMAEGDDNMVLCTNCYDYYYTHCAHCGQLISHDEAVYAEDSDVPYCRECYESIFDNADIHDYGYKPKPIFYGSGDLFFGVELEIDKGGEDSENARRLLDVGNCYGEHIYCKHDGSIDNGFEIVSHPMTPDYHTAQMPWAAVFHEAVEMGYRSHSTNTCGLHIHVSRTAFGKTREEQEAVIARIVHFVEKNWLELVRFSRRTEANLNRWAARYATVSAEAKDTYQKAKDKHMGRYVAVNLENSSTIEFRLFRGTLRYRTFIAALQMVDEVCRRAIRLSDKQFESMSWSDFVSGIDSAKTELIAYLKSRRLYVNEVQEETEEI